MAKKELSPLAKQLLSGSGAMELFTQSEFDEALAVGKAEIMTIAIETTKQAIFIERDACAKITEDEGQPDIAEKIRNRIPNQRN